jgi:hypothetical protein
MRDQVPPGFRVAPEAGDLPPGFRIVEPSALGVAGRGLIRGATYGLNDEVGGAVVGAGGVVSGEGFGPAYERGRDAIRRQDAADQQAHPWIDVGAQVVGGVGSALLTQGRGPQIAAAAHLPAVGSRVNALMSLMPQTIQTAARVVGTGAAGGALSGFGTGEGGFGNRMENAAEGAVIGGLAGGALAGIARGASGIAQRVRTAFGGGNPDEMAQRLIARSIHRSGNTLDDVGARLQAAGDQPVALVDVAGRNTQALGATAANTPGMAMDVADNFVQGRRATRPDRLQNLGDRAFGGGTGDDIVAQREALSAQRRTEAAPLYDEAFSKPAGMTEPMKAVIDDPVTRAGLARGLEIQRIENTTARARGLPEPNAPDNAIVFDADGTPRITSVPNMRTLDAVKRGLDDIIENAKSDVTGKVQWTERLRAVDDLRRTWVGLLDENNPSYAAARAAWAGPTAQMEATDAGRKAFRTDPDFVAGRMKAPPDVQDAYRLGAGRAFADAVTDPGTASGAARRFLENGQMQQRLASILPPDELAKLNAGLRQEVDMTAVERTVGPRAGSQTGRLMAGMDDMQNAPLGPWATAAAQLVSGHPVAATRTVASDQWRRLGQGINPATSNALAPRLFDTNPATRGDVIGEVRNRLLDDAIRAERMRARMRPAVRSFGITAGHRPDDQPQ